MGAIVYDSLKVLEIGTVVDAYAMPYFREVPDEVNEKYVRSYVEGLEFTYVVLEAAAQVSEYNTAIGRYDIAVNNEVYVKSKFFAGSGFITRIDYQP